MFGGVNCSQEVGELTESKAAPRQYVLGHLVLQPRQLLCDLPTFLHGLLQVLLDKVLTSDGAAEDPDPVLGGNPDTVAEVVLPR